MCVRMHATMLAHLLVCESTGVRGVLLLMCMFRSTRARCHVRGKQDAMHKGVCVCVCALRV